MNKTINDVVAQYWLFLSLHCMVIAIKGASNFTQAASPDIAKILYEDFVIQLMQAYSNVYRCIWCKDGY